MQMNHEGIIATFNTIMKIDGPLGFFKGIGAPLVSVPLINSIVFSSYELSKKFFQIFLHKENLNIFECRQYVIWIVAVCGGIAGNVNAIVVTPVELIKIKLQMQKQKRKYKNTVDCISKLVYKYGPRGKVSALLRSLVERRPISGLRLHCGARDLFILCSVLHLWSDEEVRVWKRGHSRCQNRERKEWR